MSDSGTRFYGSNPDRKRPVTVRVDKFTGYGKHVHVTMKEADDPIWDDRTEEWVTPQDPEDSGHGVERIMKFNRPETARLWIERTFAQEFDPKTHELQVEEGESYRWFYGEGD